MKLERDIVRFTNLVYFTILPAKVLDTLKAEVTPSVKDCEFYTASGSVVTVTNFIGGAAGQRLHIRGDGTTTISHNTNIKTNTGANKLLLANKVYRFTYFEPTWIEDE